MSAFQDIRILIPGYSIEDLPTDLNDSEATSLLNACAVAWHPQLLIRSAALPDVYQAEATELPTGQHFLLIPECSESWLGPDWKLELDETESVVFHGSQNRSDWVAQVDEFIQQNSDVPDSERTHCDPDLLSDFFAFGTAWLQIRLMSRRMHFFVDPDQNRLEECIFAAARETISGNTDAARQHLTGAAECLLDCREQFYPVDCYLIDLCLPAEQSTADDLAETIRSADQLTVLASAGFLQQHISQSTSLKEAAAQALKDGRLSLLSGHAHERRTSLGSLSSFVSDVATGVQSLKTLDESLPLNWARQKFGLTSSLPSILGSLGFQSALHAALDDGVYPDQEDAQFDWKGIDGTTLFASSRLPMAIDAASSFQKFADRYCESMQEDTTAVALLARLPELNGPWLEDLKRINRYAPVFGTFVTWDKYKAEVSSHDESRSFSAGDYLSPSLIQSTVLKTEAPVSSPAELLKIQHGLDAVRFAVCQLNLLKGDSADLSQRLTALESRLQVEEISRLSTTGEADDPETQAKRIHSIAEEARALQTDVLERYAARLNPKSSSGKGRLLVNPRASAAETTVPWPDDWKLPNEHAAIESAWKHKRKTYLNVKVPPGGFVWLSESAGSTVIKPQSQKGKPLAEAWLLRNQFFEVHISDKTGGIAGVYFHRERTNRISQLMAARRDLSNAGYSPNRTEADHYVSARCTGATLQESGPWLGCIETEGLIRRPGNREQFVRFRQKMSVERTRPAIDVEISIDESTWPLEGNPWMTYLASRFAWDNPSAEVTRSELGWSAKTKMERFEAPHFVNVQDGDHRVQILSHGRPYHRLNGGRMLDSLLQVEGETATTFRFRLLFDSDRSMAAASDFMSPVLQHDVTGTPPEAAQSGWLLGLTAKNVMVARSETRPDGSFRLLLQETEGRSANCRLKLASMAARIAVVHLDGSVVNELATTADECQLSFRRFQVQLVEIRWPQTPRQS